MRYFFLIFMLISVLNCTKKTPLFDSVQIENQLTDICEIEQKRHKGKDYNPNLVFFNNRSMNIYCSGAGDPEMLITKISESHGICKEVLLQLLARKHASFITDHRDDILSTFNTQDMLHLVHGLKSAPDLEDQAELLLFLVNQDMEKQVRMQVISLFNYIDQKAYYNSILKQLKRERDPEILTQWVDNLNTEHCPDFNTWMFSLFNLDSFQLQQSILVKFSTSKFKDRDKTIQSYLKHSNPQVCGAAETILAQLKGKEKLRLTPVINVMGQPATTFNQSSNDLLLEALKKSELNGIKQAVLKGADPNLAVRPKTTCVLLLCSGQRPQLNFKKLIGSNKKIDREALSRIYREHENQINELIIFLIEHGADPNTQDAYGRTPMFHAVMTKRIQFVTTLLNQGADPNIRNIDGVSAVNLAEIMERDEMMKLFADRKHR